MPRGLIEVDAEALREGRERAGFTVDDVSRRTVSRQRRWTASRMDRPGTSAQPPCEDCEGPRRRAGATEQGDVTPPRRRGASAVAQGAAGAGITGMRRSLMTATVYRFRGRLRRQHVEVEVSAILRLASPAARRPVPGPPRRSRRRLRPRPPPIAGSARAPSRRAPAARRAARPGTRANRGTRRRPRRATLGPPRARQSAPGDVLPGASRR